MARLLAGKLEPILHTPVIVEDKPGAGNVIGASAAANAAADGYTFFFGTSAALTNNKYLVKRLPYDVERDFAPVALVTRSHQILVASTKTNILTLPDLIAYDHAHPGKLSMAVDGPRNLSGVTAAMLNNMAHTTILPVPYPNINNGVQDVIAGRVETAIFSISIVAAHLESGALRALATTSPKRMNGSTIPAAAETLPGFDFSGWFMLVAPKATPPEIVAKMNTAVDAALRDPQVREMAPKLGYELDPAGTGTPAAAAEFLKGQLDYWDRVTKSLGIDPE